MFILFGLGNNESKYLKTKHNSGRIIIENLAKNRNLEFVKQKNFHWTKYQNWTKLDQNKNQDKLKDKTDLTNILTKEQYSLVSIFNKKENLLDNLLDEKSNQNNILQEFFLVYSDGFMNNSGEILRDFCSYYKLNQKKCQIVILQDDSDQLIGNSKLSLGGGTAGHNGIISIYKHFDKEKIWRLKIGIRPIGNKLKSETFVLSRIEKQEEENLTKISSKINENLNLFENFAKLQNLINSL